ncbi:MAG TPA: efflux RND transporter permease subunit [Candidatus Acidoferrum sp.]|nr:efflux RND transporter permease subunit [Candidatus Acidoferrum sp.]
MKLDIFIKRPVVAVVLSLALLLAGVFAAFRIPVIQFPRVENASLVITTQYPGASADVVQGFITDQVEQVAMTVPGVDFVDSSTAAGSSTVTAWLDLNVNSSEALAELTSRLNQIRYLLPTDALDPGINVKRTDQANALFYLDVDSGGLSRAALTDYMTRNVTPLLASIDGVQRIGVEGGRDPAMRVWLDPGRMASVGIGADTVIEALRSSNVLAAIGRTESEGQLINLLTNATMKTAADFESLVVRNVNGTLVRLRDIARVELGEDRGDTMVRRDQAPTIFLSVWILPGANAIAVGDDVYKRLDQINASLQNGMHINISYDATIYMRRSIGEIVHTLIETICLVGVVVVLMMGSLRTALVPLVTIPISILGTIALIHVMGFTLNLLTILAVVLCVGLVVDDAIVVVENVARHMREGKTRLAAALQSSRELTAPIIAMTLTLAAVYAPIGFVSGLTGALFREFTFTLAVAVLISGLVALTLSPVMSARVNAERGQEAKTTLAVNRFFEALRVRYARALDTVLAWRAQVLFVGVFIALLLVPFYMFSAKELAPVEDQGGIQMVISGPPDGRVQYTEHYMHDVIGLAQTLPGYNYAWQSLNPNGGFGGLQFVDYSKRDFAVPGLRDRVFGMLSQVTGLKVQPILANALPTAGQYDVEMVVQSSDSYEEMAKYTGPLIGAAFASGNFIFADTDLKIDQPQVRLNFNRDHLADLGLDVQKVSQQLSGLTSERDINRFNANGKSYRVIPMVENMARHDPRALLDLQLTTPGGALVPVRQLATLENVNGPQALAKFNQQRSFRIIGGITAGTTTEAALSSLEQAAKKILPAHYTIEYAGVSRSLRKEGNSLTTVLAISLLVVFLLLAVQFNSFRSPLVVLAGSVPLALSGAMLFAFLGFTTLNIYAQIGLVTLVGLVAKNAILVTEFANQLQHQGLTKLAAIHTAAQVRLRPILMTTFATVIGHFPLVLVTGAGAHARNSIGIILVAGMLIGSVFTLFVLPCLYLVLGDTLKPEPEVEAEAAVAV